MLVRRLVSGKFCSCNANEVRIAPLESYLGVAVLVVICIKTVNRDTNFVCLKLGVCLGSNRVH